MASGELGKFRERHRFCEKVTLYNVAAQAGKLALLFDGFDALGYGRHVEPISHIDNGAKHGLVILGNKGFVDFDIIERQFA